MAQDRLHPDARKKIDDAEGKTPDVFPQTTQVRPWRRGHPDR